MPEREFTESWFGRKARNWKKHIAPILKDRTYQRYLEIGIFEGESACWVMENVMCGPNAKGIGIDPYIYGKDYRNKEAEVYYQRAINNLDGLGFNLIRGTSVEILLEYYKEWKNFFNLIYIDGDHHTTNAYMDAVLCWSMLKLGGFMVFDDYSLSLDRHGRTVLDTPKAGVDQFIEEHGDEVEVLWKERQVGIRKIQDGIMVLVEDEEGNETQVEMKHAHLFKSKKDN